MKNAKAFSNTGSSHKIQGTSRVKSRVVMPATRRWEENYYLSIYKKRNGTVRNYDGVYCKSWRAGAGEATVYLQGLSAEG